MRTNVSTPVIALLAALAIPASASAQQELPASDGGQTGDVMATVYGQVPADLEGLEEGPEIDGFISARAADKLRVSAADGTAAVVHLSDATEIRSSGGILGMARSTLGTEALLNGLPVAVKTRQWGSNLVASQIRLKTKDLKTATMIRSGTEQGFAEQTAATEALRGRLGDIDKYNLKATTNVNFDTGKAVLTTEDKARLCSAAQQADAMDNALLLVVGYTDSVGSEEFNQTLSEKRASRVVNHLQQACGWKPYRMLTPTGMAESDPVADNSTPYGKAQNRRVSVNVLVSKSVDGI